MSKHRKRRPEGPLPCDVPGPDDGIDPKVLFRPESRRRDDRSVRRLCSQVREALTYALADCHDDLLQSLFVADVTPAPDATRLAVRLELATAGDVAAARERLAIAAGMLRSEVAHGIHRRRAPELTFHVVATGEVDR